MPKTIIKNAKVVTDKIREASIIIEDSKIVAIDSNNIGTSENDTVIDAKSLYATPGFIELHSHGAGGADFMDGTVEAFNQACETHLEHGVTTLLPTTVAAKDEEYINTINAIKKTKELRKDRQNVQGLHFEGPFFPLDRAGGMDERYIQDPNPSLYEKLIEESEGLIARWSSAPELKGTLEFGDYCQKHGIVTSIAHTNATIKDVIKAKEHGFNHITHLYSDMSTITKESGFRILGVLECAFYMKDLWVEVIADGCHLPSDLLKMIYNLIGPERLQLCSDSIRPAGTDSEGKEVIVGSLENGIKGIVEDGVAKMMDRTAFLGSIALGNDLVKRTMKAAEIGLPETCRMLCENPAKIMNLSDKGILAPGKDADIVLLNSDINVEKVFYKGKIVK